MQCASCLRYILYTVRPTQLERVDVEGISDGAGLRSYRSHPRLRDLVARMDGIEIRFISVNHVINGPLNANLELQVWDTESMQILPCDLRLALTLLDVAFISFPYDFAISLGWNQRLSHAPLTDTIAQSGSLEQKNRSSGPRCARQRLRLRPEFVSEIYVC